MRKTWRLIGGIFGTASLCWLAGQAAGQTDSDALQYPQYVDYPQGPPVAPAATAAQVTLTADQIDQLLAPIALYPDPLLSLILPAATYPQDIASAQQWLTSTPNPTQSQIDAQSWDASIKALVHYPTVLSMMSSQMDWTQALGAAFLNQQKDVLASVQRLRAQARTAGNLQNTADDQVVDDSGSLLIEPVNPDEIYVPQYDPDAVYTGPNTINWGVGYPIGLWNYDDFDWGGGYIVVGGGWWHDWHHPAAWDQHPPQWYGHGWSNPQQWSRAGGRPAPRLNAGVVAHLGLNRPRGAPPLGNELSAPPANAFDPHENRTDIQRDVQRARPAAPANVQRPAEVRSEPAPPVERAAPPQEVAPREVAPREVAQPSDAAPPREVAQPREAPAGAFGGGDGGAARAASARGHASGGRR